jgi:hypothetical protein
MLLGIAAVLAQGQLAKFVATGSSVFAKGKWKPSSGQNQSTRNMAVEIQCDKQTNTCTEAQAKIVAGEPDVEMFTYDVVRWDKDGIIAENSAICMTNQLNINFQSQSVIVIDAPKKDAKGFKDACKLVQDTETYRLVDRF